MINFNFPIIVNIKLTFLFIISSNLSLEAEKIKSEMITQEQQPCPFQLGDYISSRDIMKTLIHTFKKILRSANGVIEEYRHYRLCTVRITNNSARGR